MANVISYQVVPDGTRFTVLRIAEDGNTVIGYRPKLKVAQRLAENTACRQLDWTRQEDGVYIGLRTE